MKYLLVPETRYTAGMSYILWKLLAQVGIKREECAVLPLLGDETPRGSYQKIPADQFAEALPPFREQLAQISASVLIPMGGTAFRAVTGLGKGWGINNIAGYVLEPRDCVPIPLSASVQIGLYKTDSAKRGADQQKGAPRYAMRKIPQPPVLPQGCRWIIPSIDVVTVRKLNFKNITQFRAAFHNALALLDGTPLLDDEFKWTDGLPPEGTRLDGWISYDLEAQFHSTDIDRASLAAETGTWTFPWSAEAVDAMRFALDHAKVRVAHNQQFDIPILAAHGIDVPQPQFDTMLAATLAEPDLPKGLDAVTPCYLLIRPWKHLSSIRGFADPEYSAKDAFVERRLALALQARLEEEGMSHLFNDIMMPAVPVLMDMKQQGVKLDVAATARWCQTLEQQLGSAVAHWVERHPGTSPTSPAQVKQLLYTDWKLPIQRRKGDGISTDALALRVLQKKAPQHAEDLGLLLQIRETSKLLGTYARGILGVERVHPSYLPASKDTTDSRSGKGLAATGRPTASDPNIQNQPPEARIMYIPDRADMAFIELDWSQAELRIAAALSGDEAMQAALESEGGIHVRTMEMLECDKTRAKNVMFGCVPLSAQALTPAGWKTYTDLFPGEMIMAYRPERDCLEWQVLEEKVFHPSAPIYTIGNGYWSVEATKDHRWWGWKRHEGRGQHYYGTAHEFRTDELTTEHCILNAAPFAGGGEENSDVLSKTKTNWFGAVLGMRSDHRAAFLNGVIISDGHETVNGTPVIVQNDGPFFEAMLLAAVLHGYKTTVSDHGAGLPSKNVCKNIRLLSRRHTTGQRLRVTMKGNGAVWCPRVQSGFWLMRQGDRITITGNSAYGAGPKKLQETLAAQGYEATVDEMRSLQLGLAQAYPRWWAWRFRIMEQAKAQQWLRNPFGRLRRFTDEMPAALDFLPQSIVADMLWTVMPGIAEIARGYGGRLTTVVHDSCLLQVPSNNIHDAVRRGREHLEQPFECVAPGWHCPVGVKAGTPGASWGELVPYEQENQDVR